MKVGIGQDSHRFLNDKSSKKFVIGGVEFEDIPGLDADSDGDVIFHAICNAISSLSGVPILGGCAQEMYRQGIDDSREYLVKALETLKDEISHVALSVEAQRPRMQARADEIRLSVAKALGLGIDQVGLTFTSGDGMGDFGKGIGLQCLCILSVHV